MPSLSPTMERGNIASWSVKEGDSVKPGDVLAEVETDKATMAWENQDDGFIAKLLVTAGAKDISLGTPVAILVEDDASVAAFKDYKAGGAGEGKADAKAAPSAKAESGSGDAKKPAAAEPTSKAAQANSKIGPAARLLLQSHGLSHSDITNPTGPWAIITKQDVLSALAAGVKPGAAKSPSAEKSAPPAAATQEKAADKGKADAAPAKPAAAPPPPAGKAKAAGPAVGAFTDVPNSQIRRIIATRLLESKVTIPGLYISAEADLGAVTAMRAELASRGTKVSVNDCVLKAVGLALKQVPAANSFWDSKADQAGLFKSIDICVAVATERGLITPIVKDVDKKSLSQISKDVKELAGRARDNKLKPEEFMGGSFTVSNLGMYGIGNFTAIINPPQAAILAVGGASQRTTLGPGGKPVSRSVMAVTISADHRVYDGQLAADFLKAFVNNMESPINMLMS